MMGRRRTMAAAAATCSLLLSSCALPTLANQADLFFDFSSKIRVGTTSSAASDESSKTPPGDVVAADGEAEAAAVSLENAEMTKALAEFEASLAELVGELEETLEEELKALLGDDASFATVETYATLNMTTESLLSLSAQVPANSSAEEWISAYGLMSSEQQGYYSAEATGYTT